MAPASSAEARRPGMPVRSLSLRLNFSWVLAGNLVKAACRFGVLLLLAHLCGLAAVGRYAIAAALCTPIWAVVMLGLRGALVTDARGEFSFADYLAVRLLASSAGLVVVGGVVVLGGYGLNLAAVILLVAFARMFEGISDILRGQLQQQERMDRISAGLMIQGLGELGLMVVVGILGGGETLVVAALPAAMVLTLLFWDIPCCVGMLRGIAADRDSKVGLWRQPLRWGTLARLGAVAFPVAVAGFLIALIPQLPKYVIGAVMGDEAVGLYAVVAYWISLGTMVVTALGNVAAPRLARYRASDDMQAFTRLLVRLVALTGSLGVAGVAVAALLGPVLPALVGNEYSDLPQLAVSLSFFALMLFVTGPLGRALAAMRMFWSQTLAVALGIAAALVVLPWAVRSRGLAGAADAMTLSMGVVAIMTAILVWRELRCRIRREDVLATEAAV